MKKRIHILSVVAILVLLASPAFADKKGHGHSKKAQSDDVVISLGDFVDIRIPVENRTAIRTYMKKSHAKHCPPGLAKKNNGCLPPGIAKKYAVGSVLRGDVRWSYLDDELLSHLLPAPAGYRYISVDKDILLMAEATKKIVDAVTLASAIGK